MLFISLVAFSALFVAGCAAFFSIKGLVVLFSGSALAVGIMASSLEIGKLVTASFLHNQWNTMSKYLRIYLCTAVLVLMAITSLGIFGFLSGAYQVHRSASQEVDVKIEALVHEKSSIDQSILEQSDRIKALTEIRATQEERVKTAGNYKAPRDQAYKAISEANEEMAKKEEALAKYRARMVDIEKEVSSLKLSINSNTDIGSFKFIAGAMGTDVDTAVKYFILALIAVFDPLAVALVLCWNKLVADRKKLEEEAEQEYLEMLENLPLIEEKEEPAEEEIEEDLPQPVEESLPPIPTEEQAKKKGTGKEAVLVVEALKRK